MPAQIVLAEDDDVLCYALRRALELDGHAVQSFVSSMQAWGAVAEGTTLDLLITDVVFPKGQPHGSALAKNARHNHPALPVIFLTAFPDLFQLEGTLPEHLLAKPFEIADLTSLVKLLLSRP